MAVDPYEQLGVARDATAAQIKAAFRKKAQHLHPDKCPGDPYAGTRFSLLKEAYEILSDAARRAKFDAGQGCAPDNLAQRARNMLVSVAVNLFQKADAGGQLGDLNLIASLDASIREQSRMAERDVAAAQRGLARLEKQLKRFRRKNPGENLFGILIENKMNEVRAAQAKALGAQAELAEALKMLADYEDVAEVVRASPFLTLSGIV